MFGFKLKEIKFGSTYLFELKFSKK